MDALGQSVGVAVSTMSVTRWARELIGNDVNGGFCENRIHGSRNYWYVVLWRSAVRSTGFSRHLRCEVAQCCRVAAAWGLASFILVA